MHALPWGLVYRPTLNFGPGTSNSTMLVPTVDTVRYTSIMRLLAHAHAPVLLMGPSGVGKSVLMASMAGDMQPLLRTAPLELAFTARTAPHAVQVALESRLERRAQRRWGPPAGGRVLMLLVDDVNMPQVRALAQRCAGNNHQY